jgi:hypothetical protein
MLGQPRDALAHWLRFIDSAPCYLELAAGELLAVHARWEDSFASLPRGEQIKSCSAGDSDTDDRSLPFDEQKTAVPLRQRRGLVEVDLFDPLPGRARWTRRWHGPAWVAWGHQVIRPGQVVRLGRTLALDTGCCSGYALSAYVWPEHRVVHVDGSEPWRQRHRRYQAMEAVLFPASLAEATALVESLAATHAAEHVAAIDALLAARGLPPMWSALAEAHATLYEHVTASQRGGYASAT